MARGRKRASTEAALLRCVRNTRYRGKHVVLVRGEIFGAASGPELARLVDKARREHPKETPTLVYVPRADSLVLIVTCQP